MIKDKIYLPEPVERGGLFKGVYSELEHTWDFVENYYPNYYQCDNIAYANDLEVLLEGYYEDGSGAETVLIDCFDGDIENPKIQAEYDRIHKEIYLAAIQGFLEQLKQENKVI